MERIAQLQARTKLDVDGKVAQQIWPAQGASSDDKLKHYLALCERFGHKYSLERPLLLGLRGLVLGVPDTHPSKSRQAYDDAFVLLARNGATAEVREFSGATHPYQVMSSLSPDVRSGERHRRRALRALLSAGPEVTIGETERSQRGKGHDGSSRVAGTSR